MKKSILIISFCFLLIFCLTACASPPETEQDSAAQTPSQNDDVSTEENADGSFGQTARETVRFVKYTAFLVTIADIPKLAGNIVEQVSVVVDDPKARNEEQWQSDVASNIVSLKERAQSVIDYDKESVPSLLATPHQFLVQAAQQLVNVVDILPTSSYEELRGLIDKINHAVDSYQQAIQTTQAIIETVNPSGSTDAPSSAA